MRTKLHSEHVVLIACNQDYHQTGRLAALAVAVHRSWTKLKPFGGCLVWGRAFLASYAKAKGKLSSQPWKRWTQAYLDTCKGWSSCLPFRRRGVGM